MPTSRSRTTASDTLYLHRRLRGPGVQLARDYHAAVLPQAALPQRRLSPPGEPRIAVRLSSFSQISCSYGFHEEIIRKYGSSNAWKTFNETFDFLPLAALVDSNLPHSFRWDLLRTWRTLPRHSRVGSDQRDRSHAGSTNGGCLWRPDVVRSVRNRRMVTKPPWSGMAVRSKSGGWV